MVFCVRKLQLPSLLWTAMSFWSCRLRIWNKRASRSSLVCTNFLSGLYRSCSPCIVQETHSKLPGNHLHVFQIVISTGLACSSGWCCSHDLYILSTLITHVVYASGFGKSIPDSTYRIEISVPLFENPLHCSPVAFGRPSKSSLIELYGEISSKV